MSETSPGSYKIYQTVDNSPSTQTHGQCWLGETVAGNIELCYVQTILPHLLKHLPREGRILESGCGLGRWVFCLRQKGFDVTGIDLASEAVAMAHAYDPAAPILIDDVLRSRFADEYFDAVISLGVVEHFEEGPQMAVAELHRLLKPGGLLFISVPVQTVIRRWFAHPLKDVFRWYRGRKGARFAFEEYRFSRSEFQRVLWAQGFDILSVIPDDFLPPKNLGMYADFRFLHSKHQKWELNAVGRALAFGLRSMSPWLACAGAHWVCRKRPD